MSVRPWNNLPEEVLESPPLEWFVPGLDKSPGTLAGNGPALAEGLGWMR